MDQHHTAKAQIERPDNRSSDGTPVSGGFRFDPPSQPGESGQIPARKATHHEKLASNRFIRPSAHRIGRLPHVSGVLQPVWQQLRMRVWFKCCQRARERKNYRDRTTFGSYFGDHTRGAKGPITPKVRNKTVEKPAVRSMAGFFRCYYWPAM